MLPLLLPLRLLLLLPPLLYLVRDFWDGTADMSFVSEAMGDFNLGTVQATNDHFEHLTCFVGGMLILGES
ncbi:hypothetical protein MNEG_12846 [Monoraphidium neglectum]|uniref:Uncharacterized protein n=1 Tax=Monoraphidium neglectum TaxID=145388 RepID=A0A0D2LTY8_9CHLO|nr:hypothetical protein MNEG_12846 [Monoraphidium neglectum]KIY95119.1 hypothetical protein MNEG_12846 [Monoraphidium neglectum]|eukprot:XP_013894139.1 hypothetical protein MNEG_12846 [Monoraphidium neglectum]